ncbi:PREDICTED: coenzyme Q-binding protein COQ10 homolog B, mitochondrial [Polistes dominula]|uniref:Coenzyme Q-binding protein COQ10 homolog B, mitochondrial n=1 Tax=Polistes dominula TaxID=743375 RepID=A0ABM1J1C4_POLDO|nr:PREDICTED: coenzyme Q-binding protein COQ10 homolog B, mitochondrial [Polistes dominula]
MYRNILPLEQRILQCRHNYIKINFKNMTQQSGKLKEYEGRKLVGFSMEQIYTVVADVGNYKKFIPFCKKSDIIYRKENFLKANLIIGFPPLTESYTSEVSMVPSCLVKADCTDGILFDHLKTLWIFNPGLKNNANTCVIDFSLSFQFKSIIHSQLSNLFFNEIVRQMENAFLQEAEKRYGKPCLKTVRLER